jgi:hypothetical protein
MKKLKRTKVSGLIYPIDSLAPKHLLIEEFIGKQEIIKKIVNSQHSYRWNATTNVFTDGQHLCTLALMYSLDLVENKEEYHEDELTVELWVEFYDPETLQFIKSQKLEFWRNSEGEQTIEQPFILQYTADKFLEFINKCTDMMMRWSISNNILAISKDGTSEIYLFDLETGKNLDQFVDYKTCNFDYDLNGLVRARASESQKLILSSLYISGFTQNNLQDLEESDYISERDCSSTLISKKLLKHLSFLSSKISEYKMKLEEAEIQSPDKVFDLQMKIFKGNYLPSPTKSFFEELLKSIVKFDLKDTSEEISQDTELYNIAKIVHFSIKACELLGYEIRQIMEGLQIHQLILVSEIYISRSK